jgi:hypothetical protein
MFYLVVFVALLSRVMAMASFAMVSLSDPVWAEVSAALAKSYPDMCVCSIDRVVNPDLERRFEQRRRSIAAARGEVHVRRLFHGTKPKFVDSIACNGFMTSKNTVSGYGKGTYFAAEARMSSGYTQIDPLSEMNYMFVCDVCVGRAQRGITNAAMHPDFDNFVDKLDAPSVFVTPYDDGALPVYLVAFHMGAPR